MRKIDGDGNTTLLTCEPTLGDITLFVWSSKGYEGCDCISITFRGGEFETLFNIPLEVVEAWIKVIWDGSRSEFFYRDNIKGKYHHPTDSSCSSYPQDKIETISMLDFILQKIETLDEKELNGVKRHVELRLAEIERAKPWNSRPIPDYLQKCTHPITEKTWEDTWYCDVWYHAAKDGMMGPQIRSPGQIPLDATHIIEIHK